MPKPMKAKKIPKAIHFFLTKVTRVSEKALQKKSQVNRRVQKWYKEIGVRFQFPKNREKMTLDRTHHWSPKKLLLPNKLPIDKMYWKKGCRREEDVVQCPRGAEVKKIIPREAQLTNLRTKFWRSSGRLPRLPEKRLVRQVPSVRNSIRRRVEYGFLALLFQLVSFKTAELQ